MRSLPDLVRAARDGERQAFTEIVIRFQDMALGYACSQLSNVHDAEDAAQDAFVHAYLGLQQLHDVAAFPGWFRSLLRTQCSRRTRSTRHEPLSDDVERIASRSPSAHEELEREERRTTVEEAIQSLPEHEQVTVRLFYMGQQSTREIAAFLEVSVGAVKTRLHSARKRLRQELMKMVEDELSIQKASRDAGFAEQVALHLDVLKELHEGFGTLLTGVLEEALGERPDVTLAAVRQPTFEEFLRPLPTPCAIYTWTMAPLVGRVVLDIPIPLACSIIDRASQIPAGESEGSRELMMTEYEILNQTIKNLVQGMEQAWGTRIPVAVFNIELETQTVGAMLPSPGIGDAEQWDIGPKEAVVHLGFEVRRSGQPQMISLCYPAASLVALMAHIVDGAALPAGAIPVPADRALLPHWVPGSPRPIRVFAEVEAVDCAADQAHIIGNMAPLYCHDWIALEPYQSLLPNRSGLLAYDDLTHLMGMLPMAYGSWWQRPGVLFPLLIRVDDRPAGFCLVESPRYDPGGADHKLGPFFLLNPYRRVDVGQRVMGQLFDRFAGQWEISVHAKEDLLRESCRAALSDRGVPPDGVEYTTRFSFRSGE
jgi:RNA polymerase sigma factor (sigma-70 family)